MAIPSYTKTLPPVKITDEMWNALSRLPERHRANFIREAINRRLRRENLLQSGPRREPLARKRHPNKL